MDFSYLATFTAALVGVTLIAVPWHGLRQKFYRLAGRDPHLFVDVCLMSAPDVPVWLDPTRHGQPITLFDHTGVVTPSRHVPDMGERLGRAVVRFRFFARVMIERNLGRAGFGGHGGRVGEDGFGGDGCGDVAQGVDDRRGQRRHRSSR